MCTLLSLKNRKLTIFSRLMLGNLAILIMASAISSYAILQLGQMRQLSSRIIQVHNVLIDLNKEMSAALLTKTRYEKNSSWYTISLCMKVFSPPAATSKTTWTGRWPLPTPAKPGRPCCGYRP